MDGTGCDPAEKQDRVSPKAPPCSPDPTPAAYPTCPLQMVPEHCPSHPLSNPEGLLSILNTWGEGHSYGGETTNGTVVSNRVGTKSLVFPPMRDLPSPYVEDINWEERRRRREGKGGGGACEVTGCQDT